MSELLDQARELWDRVSDPYWRADHQELMVIVVTLIAAVIEIGAAYLKGVALKAGAR